MTDSTTLNALIFLVVVALIFYVCWWGLAQLALPDPFNKILKAVLILAVVVVLVQWLSRFTGFVIW